MTAATTYRAYLSEVDIPFRRNLSSFETYRQGVTCPRCGYHGTVGYIRDVKPSYANCFVLFLLFITVVGIVVILLLAILGKLGNHALLTRP